MMTTPRRAAVVRWGRAASVLAAVLMSATVGLPADAQTGVNDFSFSSYDADYRLTRDSQQHSQLAVTERLTAVFPAIDQNHGIDRDIPNTYDGHPVDVSVTSVRDGAGAELHYTTRESDGHTIVRIGDPGSYAHGSTRYVLSYDMRDVTKNFGDHDELYWDTNGTQWSQPFSSVTAHLYLDGAIASAYTGRSACYQGPSGSTASCPVTATANGGDRVLTFRATRTLEGHENLTMVVGFRSGTFAPYVAAPRDPATVVVLSVWGGVNVAILVIGTVLLVRLRRRLTGRAYDRRQIVPTGDPPRSLGVLRAGALLGRSSAAVAAQVLDLAVRGYLRIIEVSPDGQLRPGYELRLLRTIDDLQPLEQRLMRILFGDTPTPDATIRVDQLTIDTRRGLRSLLNDAGSELVDLGLLGPRTRRHNRYYRRGWWIAALGVVVLQPSLIVMGLATSAVASGIRPVTATGTALLNQLHGIRAYLETTRIEEIRPVPAVVVPVGASPTDSPSRSYEGLLPYAVLFGIESRWLTQLTPLYERWPDWYGGSGHVFLPTTFLLSIHNLTGYTAPANSTSSGLSSDGGAAGGYWGGFSGGGGGGGGGGGW